MADPIIVDIPHKLGQAGARERIEKGLGQMGQIVPGGSITRQQWDGNSLLLTLEGMGQRIDARLDIHEDKVHAAIDLPPMLSLFASKIRDKFLENSTKLLK